MKTVFNNDGVVHAWAHQLQESGKNHNGSLYFEGPVIYSYGLHFPMGKIYPDVTLLTNRSYSNTTAHHQHKAAMAVSHHNVLYVNNVLANSESAHRENLKGLIKDMQESLEKCSKARNRAQLHYDEAKKSLQTAREYHRIFNVDFSFEDIPDFDEVKQHVKQQQQRAKELEEERKAKEAIELAKALELWREGVMSSMPTGLRRTHNGYTFIRTHQKRDGIKVIQSSQGVECPVDDAAVAFAIVKNCLTTNTAWQTNGSQIRLGDFKVDYITEAGELKAGCHFIAWEEIERIAIELGWLDEPIKLEVA